MRKKVSRLGLENFVQLKNVCEWSSGKMPNSTVGSLSGVKGNPQSRKLAACAVYGMNALDLSSFLLQMVLLNPGASYNGFTCIRNENEFWIETDEKNNFSLLHTICPVGPLGPDEPSVPGGPCIDNTGQCKQCKTCVETTLRTDCLARRSNWTYPWEKFYSTVYCKQKKHCVLMLRKTPNS